MSETYVTLLEKHGSLYAPGVVPGHPAYTSDNPDTELMEDTILLVTHLPTYKHVNGERVIDALGGDVDTIDFPNPDQGHLRRALYDIREQGYLPSNAEKVHLPNGALFPF